MKFNENTLKLYAAPLSETENQKCMNAIEMIRTALKDLGFTDSDAPITPLYSDTYAYALEMKNATTNRKVKLFIQGSYANNTNVHTQSDVDIAVIQEDIFKTEYRTSTTYPQSDLDYGFCTSSSSAQDFKNEVEFYLKQKFGQDVERKTKSIKIHGNTYRKDADTVPCLRYRDYRKDYQKDKTNYIGGIVIYTDDGEIIINYPEQHIANGKQKNNSTNHYYKKMVRIIKTLRYKMSEAGIDSADKVSSFGLESLLWNIPDEEFLKGYGFLGFIFQILLRYLFNNRGSVYKYKEANDIKPLCPSQAEINAYTQFIADLYYFFEYEF